MADSPPSSSSHPPDTTRLAIVADPAVAPELLRLIASAPKVELCGGAGSGPFALPDGVEWFDDARVMLTQTKPDGLCVAVSPQLATQVCELAFDHGVGVWRPPPVARNFAESSELVKRSLRDDAPAHLVGSWWEHVADSVDTLLRGHDFQPRFSEVTVRAPGPGVESWRAHLPAAGGGVLMHDAYASVEAVLALRGMPDNVSAAIGRCRNLPQQPPRETEDVATAILRYEDGGIVAIRVGWDIAPFEQVTQHHTDIQTLTLAPLHGQLLDRSGVVLNQVDLPHEIDEHDLLQFLRLLRSERPSEIARERLMRHLQIAAVIEAIYLSARTWQPETPHKLLEVHGWPTRI